MRGPSSSHAAAPYAIARLCRQLSLANGESLSTAVVRFDAGGSFAQVHTAQGSDEGFAAGFLGIDLLSPEYLTALETLAAPGAPFEFRVEIGTLQQGNHPNLVEILLTCRSNAQPRTDQYLAISTGGGAFRILQCNARPVDLDGSTFVLIVECSRPVSEREIRGCVGAGDLFIDDLPDSAPSRDMWPFRTRRRLRLEECEGLSRWVAVVRIREAAPAQLLMAGTGALFGSATEVLALGSESTLPELAVRYESRLSGLPLQAVEEIFTQRTQLLLSMVAEGLARDTAGVRFKFLQPRARQILASRSEVPCHARNVAGVGHAFVAAAAALGGFSSFVPFDEVVDTTLKIGECLPSDLKCTCRGGLAATPTALAAAERAGIITAPRAPRDPA